MIGRALVPVVLVLGAVAGGVVYERGFESQAPEVARDTPEEPSAGAGADADVDRTAPSAADPESERAAEAGQGGVAVRSEAPPPEVTDGSEAPAPPGERPDTAGAAASADGNDGDRAVTATAPERPEPAAGPEDRQEAVPEPPPPRAPAEARVEVADLPAVSRPERDEAATLRPVPTVQAPSEGEGSGEPVRETAPAAPGPDREPDAEAAPTEIAEIPAPEERDRDPERTASEATTQDSEPSQWRWLDPARMRAAIADLFRPDDAPERDEGGAAPTGPQGERGAASDLAASEAGSTVGDEAPSESLSAETIRRALAARFGGGALPEPAAGPPDRVTDPEVAAAPPPDPELVTPSFDIVRVDRDRTAIIAGRAEPRARVEIMVGEQVIDRVTADRRGQWVSTPLEPLEPGDREVTIAARLDGGGTMDSDQVVVVAVPEPPPPQPPPSASSEPPPPQPAEIAETTAPEPGAMAAAEAPAEPLAVLMPREGEGGGRVLQAPGRIGSGGELALMVVDYDAEGKVRLSGEAPPGSPVRVYVDNRHAADVVSAETGEWSTVLDQEIAPGTYTLRLDRLDRTGKPVARLETPFTRVSRPPVDGELQVDYVIVQPGNSLWRIARRLFGEGISYVHIYEANQAQIRDPDLIYPGQVFAIPAEPAPAG